MQTYRVTFINQESELISAIDIYDARNQANELAQVYSDRWVTVKEEFVMPEWAKEFSLEDIC